MSAVGLLCVRAVRFINGLLLPGWTSPRGAAPTMDARTVFTASGLYLFGITYLWVGINGGTIWNDRGLGWFGLFVATVAAVYSLWPVAVWVTAHSEEVTA